MQHLSIKVPEEKLAFFLELINSLGFVKVENEGASDTVPTWHKDIVLKRLADYNKDKTQAMDFDIAMDDIEKEL